MKSGTPFAALGLSPNFLLLLIAIIYLGGMDGADGQQHPPAAMATSNLRGVKEPSTTEQGAFLLTLMEGVEDEGEQEEASDEEAITPSYHRNTQQQLLGAWALCTTSSQCQNGCCSSKYSNGQLKCTPLDGGFRPDICVSSSAGGTCGSGSRGNGICSNGTCCSQYGWCFTTAEHCAAGPVAPLPSPTMAPRTPTRSPSAGGTCGSGSRGNGICSNGTCCSQYGWCGTTAEHCAGGGGPSPSPGGTVISPAIVLSTAQVQAGIRAKGDTNVSVSQQLVNIINQITAGYSLYRQVAFVAHTIWESGSYRFTEELNTANHGSYQDCDANQAGLNPPTTGKLYYGRGYLQLSWCYNYKAYGASRRFQNDPNLFYNRPELVASDPFYAMDSAAWFFETNARDTSGQFGSTTRAINGAIECSGGSSEIARKRYEVFVAVANAVGLTGYSEGGCYN